MDDMHTETEIPNSLEPEPSLTPEEALQPIVALRSGLFNSLQRFRTNKVESRISEVRLRPCRTNIPIVEGIPAAYSILAARRALSGKVVFFWQELVAGTEDV